MRSVPVIVSGAKVRAWGAEMKEALMRTELCDMSNRVGKAGSGLRYTIMVAMRQSLVRENSWP